MADIITDWGQQVNHADGTLSPWTPDKWVVHYAGAEQKYAYDGVEREKRYLRAYENYHLSKGWVAIAYNYAIGMSGTLYRLRGENRSGATSGDYEDDGIPENHEARAVLFIMGGNQIPTDAALQTFSEFWLDDPMDVIGHSDVRGESFTACPGDFLRKWVHEGGYLDMAFTPEEQKELKALVKGLKEVGSNGYGFGKYGVLLIREERDLPLHKHEDEELVDPVARRDANTALTLLSKVKEVL